jgi:hypothetical protein
LTCISTLLCAIRLLHKISVDIPHYFSLLCHTIFHYCVTLFFIIVCSFRATPIHCLSTNNKLIPFHLLNMNQSGALVPMQKTTCSSRLTCEGYLQHRWSSGRIVPCQKNSRSVQTRVRFPAGAPFFPI